MCEKERMCIIGFGRMGRHAAKLFSQDFKVIVISGRSIKEAVEAEGATLAESPERAIAEANFIFLAVPVDIIRLWTPKINELTPTGCIVMDCCTARIAAEKELSKIKRKRFGLPELHDEKIPVIGKPDRRIEEFFNRKGYRLRETTAEEYDSHTIAGAVHFLGITLDLTLNQEERASIAKAKSGSYIIQLIEHLKTNSPTTYREMQLLNPNMSLTRKKFIDDLMKIDKELDSGVFRFEAYPKEKWRA